MRWKKHEGTIHILRNGTSLLGRLNMTNRNYSAHYSLVESKPDYPQQFQKVGNQIKKLRLKKTNTAKFRVLQFVDSGFKSCDSSWNSKSSSCWNWEWEDGSITTILITNDSLHFPCLPVPPSSSCHCQSLRPLLRSNNLISLVLTFFLSHFKFPSLFYKQHLLCLFFFFFFLGRGVIV